MARLGFTLLAVLFLVVGAYAVATDKIGEVTPMKCRQKMDETDLSRCVEYIRMSSDGIRLGPPPLECCAQMSKLKKGCVCLALEDMVEQMGQADPDQAMQRAHKIVSYCGIPQCYLYGVASF